MPKAPQWGGLDLDTASEDGAKHETTAESEGRKPTADSTDGLKPSTQSSKRVQRSRRSSAEVDMGPSRTAAFDDPLSGFADDDVELQLDVDVAKHNRKGTAARVIAERKASETLENENRRIEAVAKYGRRPTNSVAAIAYTGRVLWRQYRLRSDLHDLAEKTKQARDRVFASLRAVGVVMYDRRDSREMQRYRQQIRAITDAERTIQELRESHQQVRASSVELMQDVMQTIKDVQLRIEPIRAEESELLEELQKVERVRQKHEAIIARSEAEHKALLQNAGSKPDPNFVAAFDRERKKRQEQLDVVIGKINGINNKIEGVRARIEEAKQEIEALHQQRKSLHNNRALTEQQHEKKSDDAQNAYERAQAELGECALADDLEEIAQPEIAKARTAKETLKKVEQQTDLYEKAKSAYDRTTFTRGLYLAAALTGLVIVALVAISHLGSNSEADDLGDEGITQEQTQPVSD